MLFGFGRSEQQLVRRGKSNVFAKSPLETERRRQVNGIETSEGMPSNQIARGASA